MGLVLIKMCSYLFVLMTVQCTYTCTLSQHRDEDWKTIFELGPGRR